MKDKHNKEKREMMKYEDERRKKRKQKKRNRTLNRFIFVLIVIICVYSLNGLFINLFRNNLAISVAEKGRIENVLNTNGKILRNETISYSDYSGNLEYFSGEGEKVQKGFYVCKIKDKNIEDKMISKIDTIDNEIKGIQKKREDISYYKPEFNAINKDIDNSIKKYQSLSGTNYNFSVYDLRAEIESKINLKDTLITTENAEAIAGYRDEKQAYENQLIASQKVIGAKVSGVVSYYIDGFENIYKPDNFVNVFTDKNVDTKKMINSAKRDVINKGEPAFKIVSTYDWYITCKVPKKQSVDWEIRNNKRLRFTNMGTILNAEIKDIVKENDTNIVLFRVTEQMEKFLQFRDINIDIIENSTSGIKIPNSSVTKVKVFSIPNECIDSDTKKTFVTKKVNNTNTRQDINPFCGDKDNVYVKVEDNTIDVGHRLISKENKIFKIEKSGSIQGVYIILGNIADFVKIDVKSSSENYTIIEPEAEFSVKLYDNVIMYPENIKQGEFVK